MGTFEGAVLQQTVAIANQHKIEPEALLAVVEVESGGKSLEIDGKTPCLLFERHVFYRELKKAGKTIALGNAVALGLANAIWQPATQYKDEGTSSARLNLFSRAKTVDEECAIRSCSWGVGQTMGFLAEEMGFADAKAMLTYMINGGVPAQVACMIREIEKKNLAVKLNKHDWAGFAYVYNGPGYAKNNYDSKMELGYKKWKGSSLITKVPPAPIPTNIPPAPKPPPVTPTQVGIGASIAAFFAGLWAAIERVGPAIAIFAAFVALLIFITIIILRQRARNAKPQLGVLTKVDMPS